MIAAQQQQQNSKYDEWFKSFKMENPKLHQARELVPTS